MYEHIMYFVCRKKLVCITDFLNFRKNVFNIPVIDSRNQDQKEFHINLYEFLKLFLM